MFIALHRNSGGLGDRKSRAPPWRTAPCAAWILTWRPERAMTLQSGAKRILQVQAVLSDGRQLSATLSPKK